MKRQKIQKTKYVAAFALTTLIFIIGMLFGNYLNSQKMVEISQLEQDLRIDTLGNELQYFLLSEHPCTLLNYTQLNDELFKIGNKLEFMEIQLGIDDQRVVNLKKYYSILQIRHWLFFKRAQEECSTDYDLILYFYSNKGDCTECTEQGYVLDYIHKKNPDVNIYSFDVNIDNPPLNTIKSIFNVTKTPTLVINNKTYSIFMNSESVEEHLS